jgi:hypothetical protein
MGAGTYKRKSEVVGQHAPLWGQGGELMEERSKVLEAQALTLLFKECFPFSLSIRQVASEGEGREVSSEAINCLADMGLVSINPELSRFSRMRAVVELTLSGELMKNQLEREFKRNCSRAQCSGCERRGSSGEKCNYVPMDPVSLSRCPLGRW